MRSTKSSLAALALGFAAVFGAGGVGMSRSIKMAGEADAFMESAQAKRKRAQARAAKRASREAGPRGVRAAARRRRQIAAGILTKSNGGPK